MRAAAAIVVLVLALCAATGAGAARSKKIKADAAKGDRNAAPGMLTYNPEEVAAYNRGVDALDKNDYAAARKFFEAALGLNESFPEAHNNLAYTLRMQSLDNAEASLQHYARALELAPKFAQAYYYRGVLYVQLARPADAEKDRAALDALATDDAKDYAAELARVIKAGKSKKSQDALSVYGVIAP